MTRLASCVLQAGAGLPYSAIRANIADAVSLDVQIERRQGRRYLAEVIQVERFDADADQSVPALKERGFAELSVPQA